MTKCIAHRERELICANGFFQVVACSRPSNCFQCGKPSDYSIPHCLKDELPEHWLTDDGRPRFYQALAGVTGRRGE